MKQDKNIKAGSVVQISPESGSAFAACFMIVTENKGWGLQGYIYGPAERGKKPGLYYYRAEWNDIELIGHAKWIEDSGDGEGER